VFRRKTGKKLECQTYETKWSPHRWKNQWFEIVSVKSQEFPTQNNKSMWYSALVPSGSAFHDEVSYVQKKLTKAAQWDGHANPAWSNFVLTCTYFNVGKHFDGRNFGLDFTIHRPERQLNFEIDHAQY